MTSPNLFDDIRELPDEDAARQFSQLIGLDDLKAILVKQARLLLLPDLLDEWSRKHHNTVLPCVSDFNRRPPLIIFSGDVGTGKIHTRRQFRRSGRTNRRIGESYPSAVEPDDTRKGGCGGNDPPGISSLR